MAPTSKTTNSKLSSSTMNKKRKVVKDNGVVCSQRESYVKQMVNKVKYKYNIDKNKTYKSRVKSYHKKTIKGYLRHFMTPKITNHGTIEINHETLTEEEYIKRISKLDEHIKTTIEILDDEKTILPSLINFNKNIRNHIKDHDWITKSSKHKKYILFHEPSRWTPKHIILHIVADLMNHKCQQTFNYLTCKHIWKKSTVAVHGKYSIKILNLNTNGHG